MIAPADPTVAVCPPLVKRCNTCHEEKCLELFSKADRPLGVSNRCKACDKVAYHRRKQGHYIPRSEIVAKKKRGWRSRQPVRTKRRLEHLRIRSALQIKVTFAMRNGSASDWFVQTVGCTVQELRRHLESKFTEGMSWANYGKWHLDHIMPCDSFDLFDEAQQKLCFHYSNLQPLWATDNIRKANKTPCVDTSADNIRKSDNYAP